MAREKMMMLTEGNYLMRVSSKHKSSVIKVGVLVLLFGIALRLYRSSYTGFSPDVPPPDSENPVFYDDSAVVEKKRDNKTQLGNSGNFSKEEEQKSQVDIAGKCDLFVGEWVYDPLGPRYTNETCSRLQDHQNCIKNGRPDKDYLYWRWKPRDCDLPRFDAKKFLTMMRNKSWAFIGDSISRNHVQSLLCMLDQVDKVVDVYHDAKWQSQTWRFPSYNFTLAVIWSPFLVKARIHEDINGVSSSDIELFLDVLDKQWTDKFQNYDVTIISGGKWFLKTSLFFENDKIVGCHNCQSKNITQLSFEYSYRKVMRLVLNYITSSNGTGFSILRTTPPSHFEGGEWFSGGTCTRRVPFKDGETNMSDEDRILRSIDLEEYEKAVGNQSSDKLRRLLLLDITKLSLLRPDGHPGVYRQFYPFAKDENAKVQNDCLHWCLPGPVENWNDLVMKLIEDGLAE